MMAPVQRHPHPEPPPTRIAPIPGWARSPDRPSGRRGAYPCMHTPHAAAWSGARTGTRQAPRRPRSTAQGEHIIGPRAGSPSDCLLVARRARCCRTERRAVGSLPLRRSAPLRRARLFTLAGSRRGESTLGSQSTLGRRAARCVVMGLREGVGYEGFDGSHSRPLVRVRDIHVASVQAVQEPRDAR